MSDWLQRPHFAALDWGKHHHQVVVVDRTGAIVWPFRFAHTAAGWSQLREKLGPFPGLAIAVETNQGLVVQQLLAAGLTVYAVDPGRTASYRQRKAPSGTKDDLLDAWSLADALRVDGQHWAPLVLLDPATEELRLLCRDEVALIEQRTALVNQLQQALLDYYPVVLEAFDDWLVPSTWQFIESFPTPQKLAQAGPRKWQKFLHTHRMWRAELGPRRLELFARATELCGSPAQVAAKSLLAQSLVKMLRVVQSQIELYRRRIETLFDQHPDRALFDSLPGAGPKLAPRLLAEIGGERDPNADAQALQCRAGTAPVRFQSGQINRTKIRRACDHHLRSVVHLWCDHSRRVAGWAQTYYLAHRAKGQSHACALRCLGQRWLKIIWKMVQTHTPYDEALHQRNQAHHGSWILHLYPNTSQPHPSSCIPKTH